jgi:superfamily II DNA or RNA helicase
MPKLHDVILYANSKSKIKVLQSIGRGLRKHKTKNHIILYDVIDDLTYKTQRGRVVENYLIKHWKERMTYYKEQEFPVINTTINI